jgi:hypothetical protein
MVHAERLQRARVEPEEPLTEEEREILEQAQVAIAEPISVPPASAESERAVVNTPRGQSDATDIEEGQREPQGSSWEAAPGSESGDAGLEYLVRWETERLPARGQRVRATDMDADELIDVYMTAFNMGRSGPPEKWKQRCSSNGEDYGCDHLRCRHASWVRAMERMGHDVTKWTKKKSVKAVKDDSSRGSGVSRPSGSVARGEQDMVVGSPIHKKDRKKVVQFMLSRL